MGFAGGGEASTSGKRRRHDPERSRQLVDALRGHVEAGDFDAARAFVVRHG